MTFDDASTCHQFLFLQKTLKTRSPFFRTILRIFYISLLQYSHAFVFHSSKTGSCCFGARPKSPPPTRRPAQPGTASLIKNVECHMSYSSISSDPVNYVTTWKLSKEHLEQLPTRSFPLESRMSTVSIHWSGSEFISDYTRFSSPIVRFLNSVEETLQMDTKESTTDIDRPR